MYQLECVYKMVRGDDSRLFSGEQRRRSRAFGTLDWSIIMNDGLEMVKTGVRKIS